MPLGFNSASSGDAAPGVRDVKIPGAGGEHAFGPLEPTAQRPDPVEGEAKVRQAGGGHGGGRSVPVPELDHRGTVEMAVAAGDE